MYNNISPKFALYGINGVYNYGCEAIVRGTVKMIRSKWPESRVTYCTPNHEDDRKRLIDVDIDIIPRTYCKKLGPKRILRKAANILSIPWDPLTEDLKFTNDADAVLSIGGDMYTLSPIGVGYARRLIQFGEALIKKKRKIAVWGASIGPFDENMNAKMLYQRHLKRVTMITAREPVTIAYLKKIGITHNVIPCADPAFMVNKKRKHTDAKNQKLRIGINYSPLSYIFEKDASTPEIFQKKQADIIQRMVTKFEADICLIPHVICPEIPNDDDFAYLKKIRELIPAKLRGNVHFVDNDPGFTGLKDILEACDVVIAARMHCAINAISRGIPTIFVSYSEKSKGMVKYVYGHEEWLVPLNSTVDQAFIDVVAKLIQNCQKIGGYLEQQIPRFQKDALKAVDSLETALKA